MSATTRLLSPPTSAPRWASRWDSEANSSIRLGMRVIPEVRYTRWLGLNFDVPATHSRRDQIEFVFSLAF